MGCYLFPKYGVNLHYAFRVNVFDKRHVTDTRTMTSGLLTQSSKANIAN